MPLAFFWWWFWFDAYAPDIFYEGAIIAASGGFASVAVAIAMSVWRAREAREVTTYGSARWASPREVRAAGLLGPDGVLLGRYERAYHAPRSTRACAVLRAYEERQGRGACGADAAHLGRFVHRP